MRWTVPTLTIGATISTFVIHPHPMLVKGLFGPVTIIAGVLTLLTMDRIGGLTNLPQQANWPLAGVSLLGGVVTGWVAIGEGIIIAAFCMLAYGLKATRGLGVVLLSINSVLLAPMQSFFIGGVPWDLAIFTMLGVLWGGRLGPYLAQWISLRSTKKIFATIAIPGRPPHPPPGPRRPGLAQVEAKSTG